jgi:sterol desaturase/sphingolipid hydroxylase (fatty acid hydroxylase superfamily)
MQAFSDALASFWQIWSPNLALDVGRYVIAAGGMALILKLFWNAGLGRRKIQARSASRDDVRREILTSLRTGIIFSLTGVVIVLGAINGVFTVYTDFETAGIGYLAISLAAIIVAHDAYFYWTHRLMHHPRLFRYFHRTHHRSITPTPFAAYAFDVPEALLMALFTPLWLLVVPMHALGLFLFMAFMIVRNVMGHAGVELMPRTLADSRWFGWINATTHHDLHHSSFHHNYGLYFTWWDRLMGTEHPAYRERLRGNREERAALDAREPYRPLAATGAAVPRLSSAE